MYSCNIGVRSEHNVKALPINAHVVLRCIVFASPPVLHFVFVRQISQFFVVLTVDSFL